MRAGLIIGLTSTALLAACGSESEPVKPTQSISVRSEQQEQLHKLSEPNLKIALRRAMYDSGNACNTVTEAGYVQEYGNLSMWTASCASKRKFAIFVGPDGSVQVRDCKETEQLKLPACENRQRPKPAAAG